METGFESSVFSNLKKVDNRHLPNTVSEVRAFACIKNELMRLPYLLDYHRRLGVQRFLFIDNLSVDGTLEYLLDQTDCHIFSCDGNFFAENVDPPVWTNAIRNVFGTGHWCLSLDADEMFVYPYFEENGLSKLCAYLDQSGATVMPALVIDMYSDKPIAKAEYVQGEPFLDYFPYFDPELGHEVAADETIPPNLMFSKFRERAFWVGAHKRNRPPCITQVPLVKWQNGMGYLVAQHTISKGVLSELQGAVLHFKFLPDFRDSIIRSLKENDKVAEKGLEERVAYVDALDANPEMTLLNEKSVKFEDSNQLIELGWMKSSHAYREFVSHGEHSP